MIKLMKKVIFHAKIFSLLVAFAFALYISFIQMDTVSSNILAVLPMFLPFFIILLFYIFAFFLDWEDNVLCDLSSLLAFVGIIIVALRTIFDQNINLYSTPINLNFFLMQETRIKILLYLIIISNILLYYHHRKEKKKIHS